MRGPTTPPLALGNALHHALEKGHYQPTLKLEKFVEIFLEEHQRIVKEEEVFISYPEIKKNESEGAEMLQRYFKGLERGTYDVAPLALEKEFELTIEGVKIVGKIDKIEETDEGIAVIDYKTGRKEPLSWYLKTNLQFTAYWWAAKEIYGEYPAKAIWHHLRNGKLLETTRTEWDIDQLKRLVEASVKLQEQDIRPRIYHERVCEWCPFMGDTCDDPNLEQQILDKRVMKIVEVDTTT
jgi:RecB family exonuclease